MLSSFFVSGIATSSISRFSPQLMLFYLLACDGLFIYIASQFLLSVWLFEEFGDRGEN